MCLGEMSIALYVRYRNIYTSSENSVKLATIYIADGIKFNVIFNIINKY